VTAQPGYIVTPPARKESGLAYLLWLFLGGLGVHKFYLGRTAEGVTLLALTVVGWATAVFLIGFVALAIVFVWLVVDLFTIPAQTRAANLASGAEGPTILYPPTPA
jgi:TM2 domain-containing membrane protein YozV